MLVNQFEWVKNISEFNENLIKSYNNESDGEYFLEIDVQYYGNLHKPLSNLLFLTERKKLKFCTVCT